MFLKAYDKLRQILLERFLFAAFCFFELSFLNFKDFFKNSIQIMYRSCL